VIDVAIDRAPRARRTCRRRRISQAARAHIGEAMRLLYGDAPGLQGEEALAERERYRREDEARACAQGVLPLPLAPPPRGQAAGDTRVQAGSLKLNHWIGGQVPGDGSSPSMGPAGNSDPVSSVDSDAGSY